MSALLLQDKIIFLTGGSGGIGWDCARAYAAEGAKVAIAAHNADAVAKAAANLGEGHLGLVCDVSCDADVAAAIKETLTRYGKLDAVHNNAGIATPSKPIHTTTDAEWDELFSINLKSILHTTRHAFSALVETKGCILNTSSLVGVIGQEIHAAYTATKGGMNALTKSMALDYTKYGIRVNAVCPAGAWTPMLRQWCTEQPDPRSTEQYLNEIHPLGYCPDGDAIADACVFLLSDKARFITGHLMHVSGGAELGYRRLK
ncbi:MAG TPA: SDR family oxidoreductase [Verrucomicrobiae bacterium]|jgi:NAD(P)-dependent dehydrogenase (short-subunit alcohol dehydrogenase family)|nr:SDR family oxidoreductase [Verrucomicrobiae bacterium]